MKDLKSVLFWMLLFSVMMVGKASNAESGNSERPRHVFVMSTSDMPVTGAALHLALTAAKSDRAVDILLLAGALDLAKDGATGTVFAPYDQDGPAMLRSAVSAGP